MKPGNWLGFSADTAEADVLRLAAKALGRAGEARRGEADGRRVAGTGEARCLGQPATARTRVGSMHHATSSWFACLDIDCTCCFDGVTDDPDGVLPWWVEKRAAGRVWSMEEEADG